MNLVFLLLILLFTFVHPVYGTDYISGELRSYATINSIGVEWDITGDDDHNVIATVQYRAQGSSSWKQAMPLFRIDYNGYNMLAGSILFLDPGTTYEVKLDLSVPEKSSDSQIIEVTTRPVPSLRKGGRTFHVVPGLEGGKGSQVNPFKGIDTAQSVAQPGDIFLLHTGSYGGRITFDKSGNIDNYIAWKTAGDGDVILNGINVSASHIWLEGLKNVVSGNGLKTTNSPEDVVIYRNTFTDSHYCIYLNGGGKSWYIADNVIIGDTSPETGSMSGEGIELNHTSGHVVAYNRISNVADGISYPSTNVDIYGNDIFNTSDDGIEPDYGHNNIRIWSNRLHNTGRGISLQPINGGPWYFIRNQIAGMTDVLKLRFYPGCFVLAHNTLVGYSWVQPQGAEFLLHAFSRNNLWVSATNGVLWSGKDAKPDERTDLDYDGFDWGGNRRAFKWNGVNYPNIASFSAATGLEQNGIKIDKNKCFNAFNIPGSSPTPVPPQFMTLRPGCNAIDAGVFLPNINDNFTGNAPDLGAYEYDNPLPQYGPRHLGERLQQAIKVSVNDRGRTKDNLDVHSSSSNSELSPFTTLNYETSAYNRAKTENLKRQINTLELEVAKLRAKYFDIHPSIVARQKQINRLRVNIEMEFKKITSKKKIVNNLTNESGQTTRGQNATSVASKMEGDLLAESYKNLIPDNWEGVPYNPWEKLSQIKLNDVPEPDEFYFVVLADSKTSGQPRRTEVYKQTLKWILNNLNPLPVMIFEVGDLSGGHGNYLSHWKSLHEALTAEGFWDKVAYFPTIGDHDNGGREYGYPTSYKGSPYLSGAFYHEFFYIPEEIRSTAARDEYEYLNERYWAFEYENSLFVSMDTMGKEGMRAGPIYDGKPAQKEWLDKVMAKSNAQHIFFFGEHGAPFNYGKDVLPLLEKYKATAFFSGHTHNYGHYKESDKTTTYYVNGTAASGSPGLKGDWKTKAKLLTNVIGFTLVHVKGDTATTYYYCMDYPDNLINGRKSRDVYKYSSSTFHNMPSQAAKFLSGGTELIGWIMDTNVMNSVRNRGLSTPDHTH